MSPKVKEAFEHWIKMPSWHTGHAADEGRFFAFVWTVCRVSRKPPTEREVREEIMRAWSERLGAEFVGEKALYFSGLYQTLYDFAKARNEARFFLTDEDGAPLI
ncbi:MULTISPECIES: hypothetical protein [Comamonas]|uniref:hypothetical protein n=1 Tax=Comamonas TaxID=283 RepID=UPI0025C11414|nr:MULTISPECIES: hypothetical protein [Comamonas]